MVKSGRVARSISSAICALIFSGSVAAATEPSEAVFGCLTSVLRAAPSAISVEPATDWSRVVGGKSVIAKGVEFTFRRLGRSEQTVGVYLSAEYSPHAHGQGVPTASGMIWSPADNGRFALILRPPFPAEWYPQARVVQVPHGQTFVRQDSKDHPLYGLWQKLDTECHIDNLELNSPVTY